MASVLHQRLAIPLWMTALCAIALIVISGAPVPVTVLLAIALVGSMIKGRWPGIPRGLIGEPRVATANAALSGGTVGASTGGRHGRALPRAADSPAEELNDALDLVRMDDDGGWSAPVESPARSVRIFTRADGFRKDGTP
jgi:hypothetical protein